MFSLYRPLATQLARNSIFTARLVLHKSRIQTSTISTFLSLREHFNLSFFAGLKKKNQAGAIDDLFPDDKGDLFADERPPAKNEDDIEAIKSKLVASEAEAAESFIQLIEHLRPRIGRRPKNLTPMKPNALPRLVNLANDNEQLMLVAEILKLFRENRVLYPIVESSRAGEMFIGIQMFRLGLEYR
jgi:hypothetical protein